MISVDWNAFTPWTSLAGGAVIGVAAAMFALLNGRIAGISGVLGGLMRPIRDDVGWRIAFIAGLVSAPLFYRLVAEVPHVQIDADYAVLALAGLLVGIGTRYGPGCTSGHGVCGLSRFSARSFAATASFMGAGFLTVYIARHLLGI